MPKKSPNQLFHRQRWLTFLSCGFLLVTASAHRMFVGDLFYTNTFFVNLVSFPYILLIALIPINLILSVINLIKKEYRNSGWSVVLAIIAAIIAIAATAIDAPTLVYAT